MAETPPEIAWLAGVVAGQEGLPAIADPYPPHTELALDWEDGRSEGIGTIPLSGDRLRRHRRR